MCAHKSYAKYSKIMYMFVHNLVSVHGWMVVWLGFMSLWHYKANVIFADDNRLTGQEIRWITFMVLLVGSNFVIRIILIRGRFGGGGGLGYGWGSGKSGIWIKSFLY